MSETTPSAAPLTALQAVEQAAAAQTTATATSSETTQTEQPGAVTTEPSVEAVSAEGVYPSTQDSTKQGPIPFDVHHKALENARTKAKDEALTEWRQQYGWAEQIKPEQVHEMAQAFDRIKADPVAHTVGMLTDLLAHPQFAQQTKSHLARFLGQRVQAGSEVNGDIEPDIPVLDDQGREVARAYSAQATQRLIEQAVQKAINPLNEDLQTRKQREAQAAHQQKVETLVTTESERIGKQLAALPHYDAHKDAINARIREIAKTDRQATPGEIALRAYHDVVLPQFSKSAQSQVLDSLKQKAEAQTAKPSGAAATPVTRPRTTQELAKFLEHQHAALSR